MEHNKILIFQEPHLTGGHATIEIKVGQAIKYIKTFYSELSDEEALEEFININWAYYKKE